jgi:hypothetical protein
LFEVVIPADEAVVSGLHVEDFAGRQLLRADGAGEAAQVVHLVAGLTDKVLKWILFNFKQSPQNVSFFSFLKVSSQKIF